MIAALIIFGLMATIALLILVSFVTINFKTLKFFKKMPIYILLL